MRNLYIITAGILAVVAIVYFTHNSKQISVHEAVQQLDADLQGQQTKRWRHPDAVARDKAEMRKHGRVLTDEERSLQWWKEQDEAAERAAYAKLYAKRKEWIDIFPFQPRYHQNLVYDPENIAHNGAKYRAYQEELKKKRMRRRPNT